MWCTNIRLVLRVPWRQTRAKSKTLTLSMIESNGWCSLCPHCMSSISRIQIKDVCVKYANINIIRQCLEKLSSIGFNCSINKRINLLHEVSQFLRRAYIVLEVFTYLCSATGWPTRILVEQELPVALTGLSQSGSNCSLEQILHQLQQPNISLVLVMWVHVNAQATTDATQAAFVQKTM